MSALGGRLSSLTVKHARKPGMLADGNGLYLQVTRANARSWIFRYYRNGKSREMGSGILERRRSCQCAFESGGLQRAARRTVSIPLPHATPSARSEAVEDARAITFDQCAEAFITAHSAAWKNQKHVAQWKATLRTYVSPVFGSLPVQVVDVALIMKVLEPIWTTKPETAARIRGRIESVLNWAKARGYRAGENPALWKGHLSNLLPAHSKIAKVKHHAALPYDETSQFIDALRQQGGVAPLALEFAILTAARTGEIIGARWTEIDLAAKVWTVPASRMKNGREHRVPLSVEALAVLTKVSQGAPEEFVFAGRKKRPLSNMAFLMLLRRMGHDKLTAHGFRSTFRDWAAERTNFQAEVAEAALGHVVGDKVEAAYRRGDFFEKRRRLMEAWGKFATKGPDAAVVLTLRESLI